MEHNIIIISLARAVERAKSMKAQIEKLGIKNVHWYPAFDGKDLINDTFSLKINMPKGYCYRKGEDLTTRDVGCDLSHIGSISMAKAMEWDHVIILEDDIILADDFEKRIDYLFKIVPKDWEHIFLSGAPHLTEAEKLDSMLLSFMNVRPSVYTDTTYGYILRNTAYDKTIKKLTSLGSTIDDMYGNFMFEDKDLKSYTFYPFVLCADSGMDSTTHTRFGGKLLNNRSAKFFRKTMS